MHFIYSLLTLLRAEMGVLGLVKLVQNSTKTLVLNHGGVSSRSSRIVNLQRCNKAQWFSTNRRVRSVSGNVFFSKTNLPMSEERFNEFNAIFPEIAKHIECKDLEVFQISDYTSEMMKYVILPGKNFRGIFTVVTHDMLQSPENVTPASSKLALYMGWIVEAVHGFLVMADDIVDQSDTRRGLPCWHKRDEVGLNAVNDAIFLEQIAFSILKTHFSGLKYYANARDLIQEGILCTMIGQTADRTVKGKKLLKTYTTERVSRIAEYKTAYYSIHLPIALGMYMAGIEDPEVHRRIRDLCIKMGVFFQMQDDFLDCFRVSLDVDSDIQEGKCTWLIAKTLELANPSQRKTIEKYYGSGLPETSAVIMDLYKEVKLKEVYEKCKNESLREIRKDIESISYNKKLRSAMQTICNVICERKF